MGVEDSVRMDLAWVKGAYKQLGDESHFVRPQVAHRRIIKMKGNKQRMVHLTDSLVCLHTLTRGRTSSRKLRRTVARINSLLLLSQNSAVWTYVHTALNPADAPSRGRHRRKW